MNVDMGATVSLHTKDQDPSRDPQHSSKTFPQFKKLPLEIRLKIWEEFYTEPRFFIAKRCTRNFGATPEDRGWAVEVDRSLVAYYEAIDTRIDTMSRCVAAKVRPRYEFPTWSYEPVRINWVNDFVNLPWNHHCVYDLAHYVSTGCSHRDWTDTSSWWPEIRNLIMSTQLPFIRAEAEITQSNAWLWRNRARLPRLARLRQVYDCWDLPGMGDKPAKCVHREDLGECKSDICRLLPLNGQRGYFQTKYFLREAPWTPVQWRSLRVETVSQRCWWGPGQQPAWSDFAESCTKEFEATSPSLCEELVEGDEMSGSAALFGQLMESITRHPSRLGHPTTL